MAYRQTHEALIAMAYAIETCTSSGQTLTSPQYACNLVDLVRDIMSEQESCTHFLEYRDRQAQSIIGALHRILRDCPALVVAQKALLRNAICRLSLSSGLPPTSFRLPEVVEAHRVGETPDVDIYRVVSQSQAVCVKRYRNYRLQPDEARKRIIAEATIWSTHSHPGIVTFLGVTSPVNGPSNAGLCVVFTPHENIMSYMGNFPGSDRCLLLRDITRAIAYLHSNHIVHGNIRSSNVLVTVSGRACIADLGLSDVSFEDDPNWTISASEVSLGTVPWKGPELLLSLQSVEVPATRTSRALDIYAFACLTYEIFVSKAPFWDVLPHGSPLARMHCIIDAVLNGDQRPTRPSDDCHGLTAEMWSMMEGCWNRDPLRRPSATDLSMRQTFTRLEDTRPVSID